MFAISKSDSYLWPVKIETPVDGGKQNAETFDARFKRLPQSRIQEVVTNAEKIDDITFGREILVGWEGITDNGEPVPFSETMRDRLFEIPRFARTVVIAYYESLSGARTKN
jgi:hypothetical protein